MCTSVIQGHHTFREPGSQLFLEIKFKDFSRTFKDSDINFQGLSPMLLLHQCLLSKVCISPCVRPNPMCILISQSPAIITSTVTWHFYYIHLASHKLSLQWYPQTTMVPVYTAFGNISAIIYFTEWMCKVAKCTSILTITLSTGKKIPDFEGPSNQGSDTRVCTQKTHRVFLGTPT